MNFLRRREILAGLGSAFIVGPAVAVPRADKKVGPGTILTGHLAIPPIEAFASLKGDGVTDDSAALKAAHDAAFAAGYREVYCARQYNAPTAYNLGNVLFRGPGALIGTYRKKIVPFSARSIIPLPSTINPAIHLQRTAKAVTPTVLVWGDSTNTYGLGQVSNAEILWLMIQDAFARDNPGRTFNFVNRAIGGSTILQLTSTGTTLQGTGITLPTWFGTPAAAWSSYIQNAAPDLVIIGWGANNGSANGVAAIQAVVNLLTNTSNFPKTPDIIFITNNPRGTQADTGSAEVTALEATDFAAGSTRSYAKFYGYGLFDVHRAGCMARDGFDPCTQHMTKNITASTVMALPATLPMTQSDFDLTFTIDNTGGAAFGAGQTYDVSLSAAAGNSLRIQSNGSIFQLIGYSNGGLFFHSIFSTTVSVIAGVNTVEIATRDNHLQVILNGAVASPVAEWQFLRGGGQFQPTIINTVGSGVASVTVTNYVNSTPELCAPTITDAEYFGVSPFLSGGNDINHPASGGNENVLDIVFNSAKMPLLAAGRPTQTITAAAAVNVEASLVELTGPGSGTYAITLAAPRAQDQGRPLAIEMASTTGSNSVTLALTNVTGGTASTTATWSAAGQRLLLQAMASKWEVVKQDGVTLT